MISILATVDGSPESLAVIPLLEKLAADFKAEIQLLTVIERPSGTIRRPSSLPRSSAIGGLPGGSAIVKAPETTSWAETPDQALSRAIDEGSDFLRVAARPLEARGFSVRTEVVVDGSVPKAIVDYARRNKVDLIAMATHGRGGLSELVQGSVASAVLRSGVAPVLLTRPSKAQVRGYRATLAQSSREAAQRHRPAPPQRVH